MTGTAVLRFRCTRSGACGPSSLAPVEPAFDNGDAIRPASAAERLFLENLPVIDQVVRALARRHCLSLDEADELRDAIRLKMVEDDYAVLRKFEERCSLRTYLATVIQRHFLDQRNASWGKWRPSVEAKRRGPTAVLLERLLTRDRVPFDEAVEILRTNHGVTASAAELYEISLGFPSRSGRHFVGEEALHTVAAAGAAADAALQTREQRARAGVVGRALAAALQRVAPADQLLLKMRFQDGLQVAQIARVLATEPKPLYRRLEQVMRVLRRELEERGVGREDVALLTGGAGQDVEAVFEGEAGNAAPRPSLQ